MESPNAKGVNSCQECGSSNLAVLKDHFARTDHFRRRHFRCRACGARVKVTHWIVRRSRFDPRVSYVVQWGRVIAYAAPGNLLEDGETEIPRTQITHMVTKWGMLPDEEEFALAKIAQPEQELERVGRLYITPWAIKTERQLQMVQSQVDGLLGKDHDEAEAAYLQYLGHLIYAWEQIHERWPGDGPIQNEEELKKVQRLIDERADLKGLLSPEAEQKYLDHLRSLTRAWQEEHVKS